MRAPFIALGWLFLPMVLDSCAKTTANANMELEGQWFLACGTESSSFTFKFAGSNYEVTQRIYSTDCSTLIATVRGTGSFTLGGAATTPLEAKKINFTQASLGLLPAPGKAGQASTDFPCIGVTYAEDQTSSLAGKDCDGAGGNAPFLSNGEVFYGIYARSGNTYRFTNIEHPFTYRTSGLGNADDHRPTVLETTYTLQP